ncbi:MAG: ATP synthase F1 subunit delta [Candidatus Brocadiia bacterium]
MRGTVLSRRYAEALADVAERREMLQTVRDELDGLADAFAESATFRDLATTARKSRQEKKEFFRDVSRELGLSDVIGRLLQYLVDKRRTAILPNLARAFAEEADRRLGIANAHLTCAEPMADEQRERLLEKLERMTDKKIRLTEEVDESLLAGFQVSLDGRFFDGSLRGRLNKMREMIAHGG